MILMSELPRIPFDMPDTWMVKESCPSKSDLAVYENPEPSNFTWPDCGGEMTFAVSMVTRLWRRPRMQLWPLSVRTVQSQHPISVDTENQPLGRTRLQVLVEQIPTGVQARLHLKTTSFVSLSYCFCYKRKLQSRSARPLNGYVV